MFCDKCGKKKATVHIKTMINGVYVEKHLCSECAKDYDSELDLLTPTGILSSMFSTVESPTTKRCKNCGMTVNEFRRQGTFGCSDCYETFKDMIIPVIKRVQGTASHVGKVPTREIKQRSEVEQLRYELEEAVRIEDYKKAAILRDKIREIEGGRANG